MEKKKKMLSGTGCGPTQHDDWNSLCVCVCLKMWACQHPSASLHCTWGLMRRLQFTVHTEAFICQSLRKIRRYQRLAVSNFSSCPHPQGGRSASPGRHRHRHRHRRGLRTFCAAFIWVRAVLHVCRTVLEIKDTILSLIQRPLFLSHLS